MKLPKPYKKEGATSIYPEYTDTQVFDYIPRVFVAVKIVFFSERSCFFSATVLHSNVTPFLKITFLFSSRNICFASWFHCNYFTLPHLIVICRSTTETYFSAFPIGQCPLDVDYCELKCGHPCEPTPQSGGHRHQHLHRGLPASTQARVLPPHCLHRLSK